MFAFEYENHTKYLTESIQGLFKCNLFVDCTLSAEDQFIHGHQVILAACSPYLELLFSQNQDRKPIVLNDVKFQALKSLVDFMYFGEVYIPSEQLSSFVKTAKALQVKGLTNLYNQVNNIECSDDLVVNVENKCGKRKWNLCENTFEIKRESESHSSALGSSEREKCAELNFNADDCNEDNVRELNLTFNRGCVNEKSNVDSQNPDDNSTRGRHMTQDVAENVTLSATLKVEYEDNSSALSLLPFIKEEEPESHFMQDISCSANIFNRNIVDIESVIKREIEIEENEFFLENQEVTNLSGSTSNDALPSTSQDSLNHAAVCAVSGADSYEEFKGNFKNVSTEFVSTSPTSDDFQETRGSGGDNVILGLENVDLNVWLSVSSGQGEETRRNGSGHKANLSDNAISLKNDATDTARQWETSDQTELLEDNSIEKGDGTRLKQHQYLNLARGSPCLTLVNPHLSTISRAALYQCSHCSIEFSDKNKLISHMHIHKKDLQYECKLCLERFFDSFSLERHLSAHSWPKKFQCTLCSKRFTRSGQLKLHLLSHSGEKKYQCTMCSKRYTEPGNLRRHLRSHSGENKYKCSICSEGFNLSDGLKKHLLTHSGEKKYQCTMCSKMFTELRYLKSHERTHAGEKNNQCHICAKEFTQSRQLKLHLLSHSGEKNYECTMCSKRYTEPGNLRRHLRSHSGEKKYQCTVCSKRFTLSDGLKRHLRTHSGEKNYQCTMCSKRFTESGHLKSHERTHTGEKNYQCLICSERFTQSGHLQRHLLWHRGEKKYQCTMCSKRFIESGDLKKHLVTHSSVKNYQCSLCPKSFTLSQTLKKHLSVHSGAK